MGTSRGMSQGRTVAIAAVVVVAIVLAYYLVLISSESGNDLVRVGFVVLLFLAALACLAGSVTLGTASARGIAGAVAAGILSSMSYLALFSIGPLLLVGAILSIVWLVRTRSERRGSSPLPTIAAFLVGALLPWSLVLLG